MFQAQRQILRLKPAEQLHSYVPGSQTSQIIIFDSYLKKHFIFNIDKI